MKTKKQLKKELTVKKLEWALSLRKQIAALETRLAALFGREATVETTIKRRRKKKTRGARRKKRSVRRGHSGLTAAGRRKLAEAMTARWVGRRKKGEEESDPEPPPTGNPGTFHRR